MDEKSLALSREAFTEYLRVKGLRRTPERFAILDKVCQLTRHFDIETLRAAMDEDGFHVSRATLYNTLELFTDCGIVRRHLFGDQPAKYERVKGTHDHLHLICCVCGKIKEVKDPEMVKYINTRRFSAFQAKYFNLYVYGTCNTCLRRSKRAVKNETK